MTASGVKHEPIDEHREKKRGLDQVEKENGNAKIARRLRPRIHSYNLRSASVSSTGSSDNKNSRTFTADDPLKLPAYYSRSTVLTHEREVVDHESGKQKMCDLLVSNEKLIDELFHLRNYTSLVYFDPNNVSNIREFESFQQFAQKYQLWPDIEEKRSGRRVSSRVQEHSDPLRMEIDRMLEEGAKESAKTIQLANQAKPKTSPQKVVRRSRQIPVEKVHSKMKKANSRPPAKVREEEKKEEEEEEQESEDLEQLEESDPSTISISPLPEDYHLPKHVRLSFDVKHQLITHPMHITKPNFDDLDQFFNSYRSTIEDPPRDLSIPEYTEYFKSQEDLIDQIKDGLDRKLLKLDLNENVFRNVPSGSREPTIIKRNFQHNLGHYRPHPSPFRMKNELTHYDHLLAQGIRSSKLIRDTRTTKLQRGRKIAQMIENHFRRLSQEDERKKREFEKRRLKLAKDTAREVKKKWLVAVKAFKILEEREKEKERAAQSKEQLSKILDQSTKVLGAQLAAGRSASPQFQTPDDSDSTSSVNDDDYFSSSSSTKEEETDEGDLTVGSQTDAVAKEEDDDNILTAEQLRQKYESLDDIDVSLTQSSSSEDEDIQGTDLSALYGNKSVTVKSEPPSTEITEEEMQLLKSESPDPLLEESSSNEDDSGSLGDSEEESEEEEGDSSTPELGKDSDEDSLEQPSSDLGSKNGEYPGLESLFGKNIGDSDDDSVYSDNNDETPTSSPKDESGKDEFSSIPDVPVPSLLRGTLRPYQKQGLNWLVSLYNNGTNGILADEMGLGKTIQTISLLACLACEKNEWGPHLIVVPTSVMLNWEIEFKRFAPGFKVMTYYGSPQQRKEKRRGWNTPDSFHVCITSYQLVVQDHAVFRRKKWQYLILDEAHNIKNFRSQRWRSLLNFNTEHRLLLTGTPLQNNIIELWSLLYFLMPSSKSNQVMPEGFADLMNFQQWFGRPVDKIIQGGGLGDDKETRQTVDKLHQVLRPYLLRRLKRDVEKQLPAKYEHIVYCRLSKRQRLLYDDFMSRAQTKETLASGNFLSIINCLMQLRKVCNHPDLFEVRPINTSFSLPKSVPSNFLLKELVVRRNMRSDMSQDVDLNFLNLIPANNYQLSSYEVDSARELSASQLFAQGIKDMTAKLKEKEASPNFDSLEEYYKWVIYKQENELVERAKHSKYVNDRNCDKSQMFSSNLIRLLTVNRRSEQDIEELHELRAIKTIDLRAKLMSPTIQNYAFVTPRATAEDLVNLSIPSELRDAVEYSAQNDLISNPFHDVQIKSSIAFPDKSLLQYDCGKLQKLAVLLQELIPKGHRVLIFTQMAKVLDILEKFLNNNGYTYMRLDGATKIEDRQLMTERFNRDSRVNCFILSTRSGGLGINLTGADTVVFYDSDWNPAMDKQCQDRCHRIGQTRDVHIYRFVSEYTIESNILKKANQKRQLDNVIIQEGDFTTDYFSKITVKDLLGGEDNEVDGKTNGNGGANRVLLDSNRGDLAKVLEQAEDAEDAAAAEAAMKEANLDVEDFEDDRDSRRSSSVATNTGTEVAESEEMVKRINNDKVIKRDKVEEDGVEEYDEEEEDDVGHIDEYMIRFIAGGFYFD
ncbi:DEKNAAC101981 [Brettanomyces naardenensis]|uniref:Helicase SWR1 n=1 Tax=Brettanomyces naardenensis TaxID=13370 RepID=A0A448YJD6_BRENA|nr:DEKNAAC101981 [Brettanomyces naardenensis]